MSRQYGPSAKELEERIRDNAELERASASACGGTLQAVAYGIRAGKAVEEIRALPHQYGTDGGDVVKRDAILRILENYQL